MSPRDRKEKKYIIDPSLGWIMAVGMFVFAYLGYLADERWGKSPLGIVGGIIMGLIYCGYEVWKSVRDIDQNNNKK